MEPSASSFDKGAIPKIIEKLSTSSDIRGYPLEPKPGISCIPNQSSSSNVTRTRSLTTINPNRSVRLDVLYKNDPLCATQDSSMQVIFIKSKSKSEHTNK